MLRTLGVVAGFVGGIVLLLMTLGHFTKHKSSNAMVASEATPLAVARTCEIGDPTEARYFVKRNKTTFYLHPDKKKGLVINKKLSEFMEETRYRDLWTTMELQGLCETQSWLQAEIVKADGEAVEWETGWVEKRNVTSATSPDYNAGLLWNINAEGDFSAEEKTMIRSAALQVLRENRNCAQIVTGYRSGKQKGQYYVTCNSRNGGQPFNVRFSPAADKK